MAGPNPAKFDEFMVKPDAPRRGDVLTVSGRVTADGSATGDLTTADSAHGVGLVKVEFDAGQGPEYRATGVTDADGRFSIDVLAIETGEWSARYGDRRYAPPCRSEAVRVEVRAEGRPLPGGAGIKLVRTDFTNARGWASLMTAIQREWFGRPAEVVIVDDPEFSGMTVRELMGRLPGGSLPRMLVVADAHTLSTDGHELLGIDLRHEPGRAMRFTADALVEIQVNLDLGNMDFADFADSAGPGGVHRGFG